MKRSFEVELVNGVPLIHDGDNVILVDTGTPETLHTDTLLDFCGRHHWVATREGIGRGCYGIEAVAQILRHPVTTKMGLDILRGYAVLFDYRHRTITFSDEDVALEGATFEMAHGPCPVFQGRMGDRDLTRIYIDSGAHAAYRLDPCPSSLEAVGEVTEGNPAYVLSADRCWTTVVRRMPVRLGPLEFDVHCGTLPEACADFLDASGVDGIFGYDFLRQYTVLFDFPRSRMIVRR